MFDPFIHCTNATLGFSTKTDKETVYNRIYQFGETQSSCIVVDSTIIQQLTFNFYYYYYYPVSRHSVSQHRTTLCECVRVDIAGYIKNSCGNCKTHLINYHVNVSPYICEGNIRQSNKIFKSIQTNSC